MSSYMAVKLHRLASFPQTLSGLLTHRYGQTALVHTRRPPDTKKPGTSPGPLSPPRLIYPFRLFSSVLARLCYQIPAPAFLFFLPRQSTPPTTPRQVSLGDEGTRTPDLCLAKAPLSRLSYIPAVGLGRLELPTSRLSGVRSNQLSYRPRSLPCPPA